MVSTSKKGGIGAVGSGAARFFHPGEKVRKKYPLDAGLRCVNVVITGKGVRRVRNKPQKCYLVTILEVEGECFIVKFCFKVEQSPQTVFESEVAASARVAPRPIGQADDRAAVSNIVPTVRAGGNVAEQIAELRAEGIEVDDDNEPLDEGAEPAQEYNNPHNFIRGSSPRFAKISNAFFDPQKCSDLLKLLT